MKLTSVALFAAGYVIGAKAGHERYAQIIKALANASQRLDQFSSGHPPAREDRGRRPADSGS